MVMHASKYPRLNDGYYDRNKSHQYEDKYPSKNHSYSDRYNDRHESPGGRRGSSREHSPHNRYQNKQSYMDRNRERLQKGSSSSPADRRNHSSSSHGSDRRPGNDKKVSSSKSTRKDKPDIQKSALRICGEWSEHLSSKGKKYYYNINSEDSKWEKPKEWHDSHARLTDYGMAKEKERERQNGREQSRHHMSNKYDDKHRTHSGSSSSSSERRDSQQRLAKSFSTPVGAPVSSSSSHAYHPPASSSSSSRGSHHHTERANSMYSSSSSHRLQNDTRTVNSSVGGTSSEYAHVSRTSKGYDRSDRDRDRDRREDVLLSRRGSGGQREDLYEGRPRGGESHRPHSGAAHPLPHRDLHHGRKDSVNSGHNDSAYNGSRHVDSYRNDNEDSRQTEDMDISPSSTPSNSRPGSRPSSRISTPITSTPGASTTPKGSSINAGSGGQTDKSPGGKQENLSQTIQQLQILQKVLMVQQQIQKQQQQHHPTPQQQPQTVHSSHHHHHSSSSTHHRLNTSGDGDHSPLSEGTPTYEPQHLPPWECSGGGILNLPTSHSTDHERMGAGKHSPGSDCSVRSRKSSPSRSETGSSGGVTGPRQQLSAGGTSSLAAATKKQPGSALSLTPSLSNYYKEHLVDHVQGWPSDTVEKQANTFAQEGHLVGSQHCTQVSVELKRARSLVRIAEIQSTLQEQRVLFLKQQIADLERSQNTYMPPSSGDT